MKSNEINFFCWENSYINPIQNPIISTEITMRSDWIMKLYLIGGLERIFYFSIDWE